ncbi:HET-domain-containing protein [Colletotrichum asianum]
MASVTQLCDYCSLIDFSYLHNPTAAEIDSLNAGERPSEDRFPLKFGQPIDGDPSWTLGRADRIRASADTCVFCKAVKEVLIQYEDELTKLEAVGLKDPLCYATCDIAGALQPPKGTAWEGAQPGEANLEFIMRRLAIYFIPFDENTKNGLNPGRVGFKEASWKRIFHCFQTYDAARSQDSFNVKTFFGGPHNPGDILFAGRKRPSKVDMRLPIQWLKHCKENHAASCGFARAEDRDEDQDGGQGIAGGSRHPVPGHMPGYMPVFRLIDVETMAIVERTDVLLKDLNYLTLSYVWGKTPQKEMLFEANRNKLRKDNSLKGRLSRTIEDACTFTKGMGTQYLWVDALCIVQDSDADKAVQIGKMADIYANALLNIIAASGKDSHADRHVEAGLDPVISCYILRREPLRLVQVRLLFLDNPQNPPVARGSSAVSLDVVKDHYPALTTEILDKTPEDQILFFWADSARFRVTEPIKSDLWQPGWNPLERNQHAYYVQHIIDSDGKKVGETGRCKENFAAGASKSGGYEFVVIAENTAPPDFEKKRVALQVARRPDGVAYRINIAEISQVGWENATVTHGLIALGSEEGVA